MKALIVSVLALSLSACGGSSDSPPEGIHSVDAEELEARIDSANEEIEMANSTNALTFEVSQLEDALCDNHASLDEAVDHYADKHPLLTEDAVRNAIAFRWNMWCG